nr:type 1 glutamine amidotransferase [Streptomyces sp. SID8379]
MAVQHTERGGPGRVGDWLREAGLDVRVVRPYAGEALPASLDGRPLLVLGGGYLPDDDARAPWLPATRHLVAQALADGSPMLGICLGGQMLAQVAGGTVAADHGRPELGSTAITLRPEAADDPLLHGLGPVFRLPSAPRRLARALAAPGTRPSTVQYEAVPPARREHAPDAARPPSGRRRESEDRP